MNLKKKQCNYFNYSILFVLTLINTTCLFDSIEQEDDSDIVQTTPLQKLDCSLVELYLMKTYTLMETVLVISEHTARNLT